MSKLSNSDLEKLLKTEQFLEEMSRSIGSSISSAFPSITREEREDIDHEVKLKIWKKIASGKKIDNIKSYLWKVAYTTALDVLSKRMRGIPFEAIKETEDIDPISRLEITSPESVLDKKELRMMIDQVVNHLPERRKAVIKLHLLGMDLKQIAKYHDWSENKVRHLLYRGLSELKEKIRALDTHKIFKL